MEMQHCLVWKWEIPQSRKAHKMWWVYGGKQKLREPPGHHHLAWPRTWWDVILASLGHHCCNILND
jgi:hypothetical protein